MSEKTTIWLVGSGEYSDFVIEGVFSTEALAKEFAAKLKETGASAGVEVFELDAKANVSLRTEWHADAGELWRRSSPHYYEERHIYPSPYRRGEPEECDTSSHRIQFNTDYATKICNSIRVYSYISADHAKQVLAENMHHLGRKVEKSLVIVPKS